MISQPIEIGVVFDPVFPELSVAAANDSIEQVKSRVEFSQATINARDVVYADRVFLLDGLSSRCPLFRPVLFS
jgi:regulator of RNase E activity RraA